MMRMPYNVMLEPLINLYCVLQHEFGYHNIENPTLVNILEDSQTYLCLVKFSHLPIGEIADGFVAHSVGDYLIITDRWEPK